MGEWTVNILWINAYIILYSEFKHKQPFGYSIYNILKYQQLAFVDPDDSEITRRLPREILLRIFSYLDVISLCRCAQVSQRIFAKEMQYQMCILLCIGKQVLEYFGTGRFELAENRFVWFPTWHWGIMKKWGGWFVRCLNN